LAPAADWLYAHLLDGDLASNHLSWQWVAATFSSKPYLFNADNVARFAPADWHSPGTPLDASYATLEALARSPQALAPVTHVAEGAEPPPGCARRRDLLGADDFTLPPPDTDATLVHAWALRAGEGPRIGVIHLPFHQRFPGRRPAGPLCCPPARRHRPDLRGRSAAARRPLPRRSHAQPGLPGGPGPLGAELTPPPGCPTRPPCALLQPLLGRAGQPPRRRWHA
jgi:hypothetical protein